MKRRSFFKLGAASLAATGLAPSIAQASSNNSIASRSKDKWLHLGKGKSMKPNRQQKKHADVVVIGGGAAGICAAVSAARNGASVILVQDRPVLGGNASSEMRVHLNGVNHLKNGLPERETGIIEEMLLHNRFENPQESFPVWDHVLYDFVIREPNIELLLNTQAIEAITNGDTLETARCWQLTTETEYLLSAKYFIDCSGDGLLAASAGAEYRTGREGKEEFNEQYAPDKPDGWQMGASLLMSAKDMGKPMPYSPPSWAMEYDPEKNGAHQKRKFHAYHEGIWWIEVGSDDDIIADAEINRHKLMAYLHGVWHYIKNSGKFPESENLALDWVGSLPSRRESRRFIGDYILSEPDMLGYKHFDDAVAFGGWSLDEHNPGGIENPTEPPSYFHAHFEEIYQFPFRSLYSKNIANLLFAGRNVSQTHIALSSSRIMATCALQGQAVGTAASLCCDKNVSPRELARHHISQLQESLLRADVYIPKRPANDDKDLAKQTLELFASSTSSGEAKHLINGISRDIDGNINHWQSRQLPANVQLEWQEPVTISQVEIKCDTNLQRNIMMRKDSQNEGIYRNNVPEEMMKSLAVLARIKGQWQTVATLDNNRTRLITLSFAPVLATAIKIELIQTYGKNQARLYEVRAYA
ncbi:FAD-dependent oxidoreductase [Thalassotalea sp. PLHSN55]|uniref:FAD-dependent oxidoreductase n=1 Tax=Thalassotalea sp. PLHSN55 TaxID=3435888 RepID=UPI003F8379F3